MSAQDQKEVDRISQLLTLSIPLLEKDMSTKGFVDKGSLQFTAGLYSDYVRLMGPNNDFTAAFEKVKNYRAKGQHDK